jgi:hypothetical protein
MVMPGGTRPQRLTAWMALVMLVIVSAGTGWLLYRQSVIASGAACQSRYAHELSLILAKRAELTDETASASSTLQAALLASPAGPAAVQARETYQAATNIINQQRTGLPVPISTCLKRALSQADYGFLTNGGAAGLG